MSPSKNTVNPRTPRPGAIRIGLALLAFIAVVVTTLTASPALAQTPTEPSEPKGSPAGEPLGSAGESEVSPADRGPTDGRELEAFLDGFFAQQLKSSKIPGATVSVVKDGEVLFAKGYGEADVEAGEPVVADETLFRIASTSKLFTSTAVMQLVEEGKLDLDEDVNAYLDDVEIPDTYPGRPVTLRHLLTHTAGFEESFTGSGARDAADVEPLGEYLSKVPARVRPPGEVTSYSIYLRRAYKLRGPPRAASSPDHDFASARSRSFIVFMKRLRNSRPLSLSWGSRICPTPFSGSTASTCVDPSSS